MDTGSDMSLQGMVPLVLHKIVHGDTVDWEDVREDEFRKMLDFIGHCWAVFRPGGRGQNARWMLTFDDGYLSDYDIVFPLLAARNIQATFFLITDKIGAPGYVGWSQVEEMHRHGMCIGSHSRSHRRMTALSTEEAVREFGESKQRLEDYLGAPVEAFSYPFGACSPQLHQLGFAAGYRYLCTSAHGVAGASERVVPRNSINSAMGWEEIAGIMEPTAGTRLRWFLEDRVKGAVKGAVGHERYIRWRNRVLGER